MTWKYVLRVEFGPVASIGSMWCHEVCAVDGMVTVRVDVPPAVTVEGLKDADQPAGSSWQYSDGCLLAQLIDSDSGCAAPLVTAVEIVVVTVSPGYTRTVDGCWIEKSSGVLSVKVPIRRLSLSPLLPLMRKP